MNKHTDQALTMLEDVDTAITIKNRKYNLEGSLDKVLLAAELELPKILLPRLSQHTSDVSTECARKLEWLKQPYSLYLTRFLEQ